MKFKLGFLSLYIIVVLYINGDYIHAQTNRIVGPLLETQWWMGAGRSPYTDMAPENSRIGCGGAAAVQIMRYHRHPVRGIGRSEPYTTTHGVNIPSVNFANFTFNWDNTLNRYANANSGTELQRRTIAEIYYHVTVGISMDFGRNGGGGGMRAFDHIMVGLTTYFGYDKSMQRLDRIHYDDAVWEAIIKEQLNAGLPVLYWGCDNPRTSDHIFIIDGYDNNTGKYHINWGWNGQYDGWYSLSALQPGNYNFNHNHVMRINIKPDAGGIVAGYGMGLTVFTASNTSVTRNERFTVTYTLMNFGYETFPGGQAGAALVDNNGNIVAILGTRTPGARNPRSTAASATMNCIVPNTVRPGRYQLRMVIRPGNDRDNNEWRIATLSLPNILTSIDFTVR